VIVDMQNDFVRLGAPMEVPDARATISARRALVDAFRRLECTAIVDELTPAPGDLLVEKSGYGAFHGTALAEVLRARSVESLAVTGTVTQICVKETAREAFHHGFRTTVVADAVSSYAPDLHAATLKNFALKFGWVETTAGVLARLER
jgi:nicotinamidase-related amidase